MYFLLCITLFIVIFMLILIKFVTKRFRKVYLIFVDSEMKMFLLNASENVLFLMTDRKF